MENEDYFDESDFDEYDSDESHFTPNHLTQDDLQAAETLANLGHKCNICCKNLFYDCQPRKIYLFDFAEDGMEKKITLKTCNACGIRFCKGYK